MLSKKNEIIFSHYFRYESHYLKKIKFMLAKKER